jgi:hypothetical protein
MTLVWYEPGPMVYRCFVGNPDIDGPRDCIALISLYASAKKNYHLVAIKP